jgi:hypothetical protein
MRNDAHAPSNFDPADYRVIDYIDNKRPEPPKPPFPPGVNVQSIYDAYDRYLKIWQERIFEHFPDWRTGGDDHQSIHQCNHCGHPGIRWVAVVEHIPTGAKLAFGETCAERVELEGRDAFRSKFIKDRAAREQAAYEKEQARMKFNAENAEVVEYLRNVSLDYDSPNSEFEQSLARQLSNKGELSEAQVEAIKKTIARNAEFAARKAEEAKNAGPFRSGKRTVEGVIVSSKWQDSQYGGAMKMLIKEDDGNKVWGTMPELIVSYVLARPISYDDIRGMRVRFNASVEQSRNDEHFGFYKRPTKPEILQEVAA